PAMFWLVIIGAKEYSLASSIKGDVRHLPSPSPCGRGEVFSLDIPFYRTRQLLGEAISKIQSGTVAARFPEVAINLMRYVRLRFVDRLHRTFRCAALFAV